MAPTTVFRLAARGSVIALLALAGAVVAPAGVASAAVPNPVVAEPPVPGIKGHPLWDSWFELGPLGYEEHEYFVSGTATLANGGSPMLYTTRIIVTRPSAAADWNGAVLLDWTNVTAQFENAVDTVEAHEYLLREGWATVHVSAQSAGICCNPLTPQGWDPERYESLDHPGDNYSNSMFSQIAQAIDSPVGLDPLGGFPTPRRLIAAGQSQSAGKLDNYVRNAQVAAGVIDGFLIHGGGNRVWTTPPSVPVFHLQSDAEASSAVAPVSGPNYNLWEVAGAAHSDFWIGYHSEVGQGPRFAGAPKQPASAEKDIHGIAGNYGEMPHPMHATCIFAGASFPMRYAASAALHHLDHWIQTGTPPPTAPRFQMSGSQLARDPATQNALGGLRLPPIDVPVASYLSSHCALGGLTVPFTEAQLLARYATHDVYYAQMEARTADSVAAGYLLPEDAVDLLARACAAKIRWQELPGPCTSSEPVVPEAPLVLLLPLTALAAFGALAARRRRRA